MKRRYDPDSDADDEVIEEDSILDMDADEAAFSPPATPLPAPRPPAKAMPKITPPPEEKLKRPKAKADKALTSILQAHLPSAASVGDLQTVFCTILPDLSRSKEDSWKQAENDLYLIRSACITLPGVILYFVALETHPGTRPMHSQKGDKKKDSAKKKKSKSGEEEEEEEGEDEEEERKETEETDPATTTKSTRINPRTHYPHYHVLLYFPVSYFPRIDFSCVKRLLQEKFPGGDIQDKRRTKQTADQRGSSFVKVTSYTLKGGGCSATADNWKKYVDKEEKTSAPLPQCYSGQCFSYDADSLFSECCRRLAVMLTKLQQWCTTTISIPDTAVIEANSVFFREENEVTLEHRAMREFSTLLKHMGVYLGIGRMRGQFYRKLERSDYLVMNTYSAPFSLTELKHKISQHSTQGEGYLLKYGKRLTDWFDMIGTFEYVDSHRYEWVELKDCYYCIRSHKFVMKNDSNGTFEETCFRAYEYTRAELESSSPTEWLQLVEHVCGEPDPSARFASRTRLETSGASVETSPLKPIRKAELLRQLALLLRRRYGKQPVPFLYGSRDTGKTTLLRFLLDLYPDDAIANIAQCVTPLATLHRDTAILFQDEFDPAIIKRELLLRLVDGSQRLDVRRMHENPELIENPMMPIVFCDNYRPAYRNDDSEALDTRLIYFHFTRKIPTKDNAVVQKMSANHLYIVYYLNQYLSSNTQ